MSQTHKETRGCISELEIQLFDEINRLQKQDPLAPTLIVASSNLLALYLRREFAKKAGAAINTRFITLGALVERLGGDREVFPPYAEEFYLLSVLADLEPGYFKPVWNAPGFPSALLATLQDLMDGQVSPEDLRSTGSRKLAELATIYQRYRLHPTLCHRAEQVLAAASNVARIEKVYGVKQLFVYGFYDFTRVQESLLEKLGRHYDVTVFRFQKAESDIPRTRYLSCGNRIREAEEIVREIASLAKEGTRFDEIGVLIKQPSEYTRLLVDFLEQAGIPCFVTTDLPLSETAAGKSLLLFLSLLDGRLRRTEVMDFARTANLDFERLMEGPVSLHVWDRLTREAGVVAGRDHWKNRLSRLQEVGQSKQKKRPGLDQVQPLQSFLLWLFEWIDAFEQESTWASFTGRCADWIRDSLSDDESHERVLDQLQMLSALDRVHTPVSRDRFVETVGRILQEESQRRGRFQQGRVHLCPLHTARGVRFPVVFVPGMVEKAFPVLPSQDPVLLDQERHELNRGGAVRLPIKARRSQEEEFLFSLVKQSARDQLFFTYPRHDENQLRPRQISHYLLEAARPEDGIRPGLETLQEDPGHRMHALLPWHPGERERSLSLQSFRMASLIGTEVGSRQDLRQHLEEEFSQLSQSLDFYRKRWESKELTEYDGMVGTAEGFTDFLQNRTFSPTQLETFAACPYQYLLSRIFGLETYEAPDEVDQLSPLDRGRMLHDIYEAFYRQLRDQGHLPLSHRDYPRLRESLMEIAEVEFQRVEESGLTGRPFFWELEKENLRHDLTGFLHSELEEHGGSPIHFEKRFGWDRPFSLKLGDGSEIPLLGFIDRIDKTADGRYTVIDYKTGGRWFKRDNSFHKGQSLQLPIYLLGAADLLDVPTSSIDAEYYFSSRKGEYRRTRFTSDNWEEKEARLLQILEIIATSIRTGRFLPTPKPRCRSCAYNRVCDRRIQAILERKSESVALEPVGQLEGFE